MATRGDDIAAILRQQIGQFGTTVTMVDVGTVVEVGDGIARIQGLATAKYNELLRIAEELEEQFKKDERKRRLEKELEALKQRVSEGDEK